MTNAESPASAAFAFAPAKRCARRFFACVCLLVFACGLHAQTGSGATPKPPATGGGSPSAPKQTAPRPWTRYCVKSAGFCFEYPVKWVNLGLVLDGAGVVVAEPAPQRPREQWNQIMATALELPEPAPGSERPSLDALITHVLSPPPGATIHSTQRKSMMISGYPTQVVTVEIQEEGKPPAVEVVAFIDAEPVVYNLALRCLPSDLKRLQPIFEHALRSWREAPVQ